MIAARVHLANNVKFLTLVKLQNKLVTPIATINWLNKRDMHAARYLNCNAQKLRLQMPNTTFGALSSSLGAVRFSSENSATIAGIADEVATNSLTESRPLTASFETEATNTLAEQPTIFASTIANDKTLVDLADIPAAPAIPVEEVTTQALNALGEPTFASIGLGGWTPVGIVQNCMEFLHVTWDIPWWGAIAIGTLVVRTIIFPLVIIAQRNAAKMNNYMPQMQVLQLKLTEARQSGNALESSRCAQEMMQFMREKQVNPIKNMVVPLAQAPLFISFFMGLRAMANTPVASMREGGLFWFTDLTVSDPTFILPLITSATLYLTIEIGTDSARLNSQNLQTMKYVLRALPIAIFPFTMNFPSAILCYWACANFISLGQVALLKIPSVREYFKIDKLVVHDVTALPVKKKKFVEGIKDSWQNMKITKEIEERSRLDEIRFAKAGRGPIVKTYKYDPTKPRTDATSTPTIAAKKRD